MLKKLNVQIGAINMMLNASEIFDSLMLKKKRFIPF